MAFNFAASGPTDSDRALRVIVPIPDRISVVREIAVWVGLREFWAPATAAASGGGATSGASSAASSASGGSSTPTSSSQSAHNHRMFDWINNTGTAASIRGFQARTRGFGA